MALVSARLRVAMDWSQETTITGFEGASQADTLAVTISPTISAAAAKEIYFVQGTLAAGASVTFDLRSVTEPAFNQALTPSGCYMIVVQGQNATWRYDQGATNPLAWFLGGTGPQINGAAGGVFGYGSTTATTIDASNRNVRITNTHGSTTLTYRLAVTLKTA